MQLNMCMNRGQARAAASGAGATKATRAGWLKERDGQQPAVNVKKEYLETVKKVSPISNSSSARRTCPLLVHIFKFDTVILFQASQPS